ncbi:MAG: SRPBCC family protein [Pseudomonadota bacterium]
MARTDSNPAVTAPMTESMPVIAPVQHDSFVLERHYPASAALVFRCWSTLADKKRWFFCEDWGPSEHTLDFRIGGREYSCTGPKDGPQHIYEAVYQDIVPEQRFVVAFSMTVGTQRISSSLLTVELFPERDGTRLKLTEQIAVLDARYTVADRKHGTAIGLDHLADALAAMSR